MELQQHTMAREVPAGPSWPWRMALWLLLAASVVYFTWRGPLRAAPATSSGDLTVGYAAGLAWLHGENPYSPQVLGQYLTAAGAGPLAAPEYTDFMRNIYFPVALPMYVPLGGFDWTGARWAWILLNVAGVAVIGLGLLRVAGLRPGEPRALVFLAMLMALAPVHSTIAMGQTGILATALVVAAAACERRQRPVLAGVIYGLAVAVKLQIALPFLAYVIWKRRWPTAVAGVVVIAAMTLLSVGRMEWAGVPWYGTWMANLVGTTTGGGHNDASLANPGRHSMLCLPVLLHCFTDSRALVTAITYAVVLAAALFTVFRIRGRYPKQELLALSMVAALTLLVTYHRTYDAVLLAFPLAWAVCARDRRTSGQRDWLAAGVLLLFVDFVAPLQTMLAVMQQEARIPRWLCDSAIWNSVLLTQQTWAVILMAGLLLAATLRRSGTLGAESGAA